MKIKYISRKDWWRITRSDVVFCEKHLPQMHFVGSLYRMHEVTAPLQVTACREEICAADAGYCWLHVLPEKENWCLTAMYDANGAPVQYYFDITLKNTLEGENSRFTDLYLDIVCLPDGRTEIIDQQDLDEALADGVIAQTQFDLAQSAAHMLQNQVETRFDAMVCFCNELYKELNV